VQKKVFAGDIARPQMSTKRQKHQTPPPDVLKTKIIDLSELRTHIALLAKEGIKEISIYDLLIYIKGLAYDDGQRDS